MSKRKTTDDAIEILRQRYYLKHPERLEGLERARLENEVARKLYVLREDAGLTQGELAKLAGTSTAVISQLEDADYEGHSLAMLNRIAAALNKKVQVRFVSLTSKNQHA